MKKIIFLLSLCLLLCACSANSEPTEAEPTSEPTAATRDTKTPNDALLPAEDVTQATGAIPSTTEAIPSTSETHAPTTEEAPQITEGTTQPTETNPPLQALPEESSAWSPYSQYGDKLGLVLNEPVDHPPQYTTLWMEGEYECAYIIPRFVGSYVNLYALEWSEDYSSYTLAKEPEYSTLVGDGCIIYSVLPRPEGFPTYYIEIVAPNGVGDGYILQYDGRDGTAPMEFFDYKG